MKATKGYYSLIQFCPDASCAEAANVGVLLFCPDIAYIRAVASASNDRIRRFFRGQSFDLERINAVKQGVVDRVETQKSQFSSLEDLQKFINTRANDISLTDPRPMKVTDPDADLQRLFSELVGGRQSRLPQTSSVAEHLRQVFSAPGFEGRVQLSHHVRLPVVNREIVVPMAYQNGVLNLVQAVMLPAMATKATNLALQFAGEDQLIKKHTIDGHKAKLIVVYGFRSPGTDPALEARVKAVFQDLEVRSVSDRKLAEFAIEVDAEAHVNAAPD